MIGLNEIKAQQQMLIDHCGKRSYPNASSPGNGLIDSVWKKLGKRLSGAENRHSKHINQIN